MSINPDSISIDYAELRIVTRAISVAEPRTLALLGVGLLGLGLMRRGAN